MTSATEIAQITVEPATGRIKVNFTARKPTLKFKCQRCAVFCCKLGPPTLLPRDTELLGHEKDSIEVPVDNDRVILRETRGGACVFLRFNPEERMYDCSIHDHRPTLCRLYPFEFRKMNSSSYKLTFIPCCNGLNTKDGQTVDRRFFAEHLEKPFRDFLDNERS